MTLHSIGDGVIATDSFGWVTNLNAVAEALTGWKLKEAQGQSIDTIFNIVNSQTRDKADNPVWEVLEKGQIVNLANHQLQAQDTTLDVSPRGLCFSPNGSFIYIVKGYNIFQYEWNEPDSTLAWYHIANLDTTWQQFQKWSSAYLGPDNKIYIGNLGGLGKAMSTIDNPDIKGAGCGFCPKCFQFPKIGAGNPPCMPNYALGADLPCWPLGTDNVKTKEEDFEVYPNPASTILHIKTDLKKIRELYNSIGQLLMSTWENDSNISHLKRGVYYLKCGDEVRKVIID